MRNFTKNDLSSEINEDFKDVFIRLYDYMIDKKWMGACHALTAILCVFAKKLGIDCVPYIGVVQSEYGLFDHSWLEIEGKVYDLAISLPLDESVATGPIFNNINLLTKEEHELIYGCKGIKFDSDAKIIVTKTIYEYIAECPGSKLLKIISDIGSFNHIHISKKWIEGEFSDTYWSVIK